MEGVDKGGLCCRNVYLFVIAGKAVCLQAKSKSKITYGCVSNARMSMYKRKTKKVFPQHGVLIWPKVWVMCLCC